MAEYRCVPICGTFHCGEGPHWQHKNGSLYFVDAFKGLVCSLDVNTRKLEKKDLGGFVLVIVPWENTDNQFLIAKDKNLLQFNWQTGCTKVAASIEKDNPNTRFNDGKCDRKKRFWIGTMGVEVKPGIVLPDLGALYSMNSKYEVKRKVDKVSLSNGITWSLDNRRMFFVDSALQRVYVFDFDENTGEISNQRVLLDKETFKSNELPDGLTIDTSGKIYVACWEGSRVIRVDPETKAILNTVKFEKTSNITSLCFGGKELNKLYVTSAYKGLSEERHKAEPLAGSVFEVTFEKENIKGLLGDNFCGECLK